RKGRDPAALGLAAERPAEPPRAHLHFEADLVRGGDDLGHRPAVVREVVLRERVQHRRVAARRDVREIAADVTGNADAEVRDAGALHAPSPPTTTARAGACATAAGRWRRCDSSATSRYRSPR